MAKAAKRIPGQWRVQIMPKGKARRVESVFITNGPERAGYFASAEVAQTECDRLNSSRTSTADDRIAAI